MNKHALVLIYCLTLASGLMFNSCSNDSEGPTSQEKILIAKWLFISDHNYSCDTNELYSESFASSELIVEYSKNGTFIATENEDGTIKTNEGTWELTEDNKLFLRYNDYDSDDYDMYIIEFKDSNNTIALRREDNCKPDSYSTIIYSEEVYRRM